MIKKIKLLIPTAILIFLLILSTTAQPIGNYTSQQKQEDFLFIYNLLEKEYPFFGVLERKHDVEWLAKKSTYLERIKATKNDTQFYNELKKIINNLRDGHTSIVSPVYYYYLKDLIKRLELDSDEYNNEFLVKSVVNANKDYEYWSKKLGYTAKSLEKNGSNNISKKSLYYDEYHNGNTIYLRIKSFTMSDEECQQLYDYIVDNKDCSNIIIDIRGNRGGNSGQWLNNIVLPLNEKTQEYCKYYALRGGELGEKYASMYGSENRVDIFDIPKLPNYPSDLTTDFQFLVKREQTLHVKDPIGFNGDIYVLIDDRVYSAAEGFADFCKRT